MGSEPARFLSLPDFSPFPPSAMMSCLHIHHSFYRFLNLCHGPVLGQVLRIQGTKPVHPMSSAPPSLTPWCLLFSFQHQTERELGTLLGPGPLLTLPSHRSFSSPSLTSGLWSGSSPCNPKALSRLSGSSQVILGDRGRDRTWDATLSLLMGEKRGNGNLRRPFFRTTM